MTRSPAGRARGLVIAVASIWAGLAGCSDAPPEGSAEVELGTGMFAFAALPDGEPLDLVAGPQGGFHFIVHARMRGLSPGDPQRPEAPGNPTTWFRALDENGTRVDVPEVRQLGYTAQPGSEDWYILQSGRILRIENAAVPRLYGRPVTIEVQVRDASGRMAGDTARITAVAYPPLVDAGSPDASAPGGDLDAGPGSPSDAAPAVD